ncbi:hypothetical protein C0431_13765 [bacterium]|nr:hypothetical protein [bacterium]
MFYNKYPSPANFTFAQAGKNNSLQFKNRLAHLHITSYQNNIHRIHLTAGDTWPENLALTPLNFPDPLKTPSAHFTDNQLVIPAENQTILGVPEASIGLNGQASIFQFLVAESTRYYGMGQKSFGELELSGYRTVNWNTDVWSDFHWAQWGGHPTDPSYFTTPYIAVKFAENQYAGFLLHNPAPTFMETPGKDDSRVFVEWQRTSPHLILGAYDGQPDLVILTAESLAELTSKLNQLVGTCPRPPVWSLGYHQSRWGYGGHNDLINLRDQFKKHEIPVSGLWLDLDYMDGYRIFQTNESLFPQKVEGTAKELAKDNIRIVPIIDPGVKSEPGYRVYDDGIKQNVFCQNTEGNPFIGLVWPGETVFPDFTLTKPREWWATYSSEFRNSGFGACWVDMNDPSTGPVDPSDMLFQNGRHSHHLHRNQYSLGMQMATFAGFKQAVPNERPFILSRSGFTGTSRYAAIWTGDNVANDFYLKLSITTSLGMNLSGHIFNGADIGGFGGNSAPRLMERWMQANFLFPFARNHSNNGTKPQEPFAYPATTRDNVAHYIRLRYQFLPYLYNLFIAHERTGAPFLRPLFHDFSGKNLDEINDQFLVGPNILQAPIIEQKSETRGLVLPGKHPWFDAATGTWMAPGKYVLQAKRTETPLFFRTASITPLQPELPTTNRVNLDAPAFLLAFPEDWRGETTTTYLADDGLTDNHTHGEYTEIQITVRGTKKGLEITTETLHQGHDPITPNFLLTPGHKFVKINGSRAKQSPHRLHITGKPIKIKRLSIQ